MKALIVIDPQNDFCPGGALAVNEGDQIIGVANKLIHSGFFDKIVLTQDWHPADHGSFASVSGEPIGTLGELNGNPQVWWPDHCVQGSHGAQFHKDLDTDPAHAIIRKGTNKNVDSYSGLYDNDGSPVGLSGYLGKCGVTTNYIMGLATDYCVKFTVLDSIADAFSTYLILDGCRAVNLQPDDGTKAVKEMEAAGAILTHCAELLG